MANSYLDSSGLTIVWGKVKGITDSKVDKVDGKTLSSNDYTSDEKAKLANIAGGAQVNALEGIQKNGQTVPITNKIANISVPTSTSQLTNNSGFLTVDTAASDDNPQMDGTAAPGKETTFSRADHVHPHDSSKADKATTLSGYGITDAYTKGQADSAIAKAVAGITGVSFSVVDSLPTSGAAGTIYLVADAHSDNNDAYDEYIYVNSKWEKLGNTDVDLSGYQTKMAAITESEINTICV